MSPSPADQTPAASDTRSTIPAIATQPTTPPYDADTGEARLDFLWRVHSYTNDYIRFADTKAGFTAGTVVALIGALVASHPFDSVLHVSMWDWPCRMWWSTVALLALVLALIFAIYAIKPRLNSTMPEGFIFWDSVAQYPSDMKYAEACQKLTPEDMELNVSRHIHTLALICRRKYFWTNLAILTGCAGGAVAGGVILFIHGL